ncbi:MAG: sigma-54 dependent transcriptional regulator [Vicinamibacteria bacterium]
MKAPASPVSGFHVLIVDDPNSPPPTRAGLLESLGCSWTLTSSQQEALNALDRDAFDLAIIEEHLGGVSALDLVPQLLAKSPALDVLIVADQPTVETAVEAMRHGAADYLPKPAPDQDVRRALERVGARRRARTLADDLRSAIDLGQPELDMVSRSPRMSAVFDVISAAANSDASVLFRGESGTGKSVLARLLHAQSRRARKSFVVVSCPVLSEELLASELFGHAQGAFTGASREKPGRVEIAHGGTLFLDEIGDLPASLQPKLLRFLQDREFERVGETLTRRADVRVVAATHRDLPQDVRAGRFREDLMYRLNVIEVTVPPLRERPEDIERVANQLLRYFAAKSNRPTLTFSEQAAAALMNWNWPGNLRELRNVIERAVVLSKGSFVEASAFPFRPEASRGSVSVGGKHSLASIEDAHIEAVLAGCATQDEAAVILDVDPSTLWRRKQRALPAAEAIKPAKAPRKQKSG